MNRLRNWIVYRPTRRSLLYELRKDCTSYARRYGDLFHAWRRVLHDTGHDGRVPQVSVRVSHSGKHEAYLAVGDRRHGDVDAGTGRPLRDDLPRWIGIR